MTQDHQPPRAPRADFTRLAEMLTAAQAALAFWREARDYLPRLHAGWDTVRLIDSMAGELVHQRRCMIDQIRRDEVDTMLTEYNSGTLTRRHTGDAPTLAARQRDFWGNNLAGGAR